MDKIDRIKANIIAKALIHNWKKIPFINDINKDYLLYKISDDRTLFDIIIDYKKYYDFPLSLLNIDWSDNSYIPYVSKLWLFLTEDDLFIKCNILFKGLHGEKIKEKPLLYLLLKKLDFNDDKLVSIINKAPNHYLEVIDVLVDIGRPEHISLFSDDIIDKITANKDNVFDRYKDNNTAFIYLARLLKDKNEVADICEKYNHKDLENSINTNTKHVSINVDSPTKRKEDVDINLLSDVNQNLMISFYDSFVNNKNKNKLKIICSYIYDSLVANNKYAQQVVEDMIRIKRINKDFWIVFDDQLSSKFVLDNPCGINFNSKDLVPDTVFHEFTHAIHYYNNELLPQPDISNKIELLKSNPSEIRERLEKFLKENDAKADEVMDIAREKIDKAVEDSIEKYKDSNNLDDSLINHSIDEEIYFQKMRKVLLSEYNNKYYSYYYPEYEVLSDIFDAIFNGIPHSYFDVSGHGVEYFKYNQVCTCEIIADFMSVRCLPDSEKYLNFIKDYLGDELFNIIEQGCYNVLGYDNLSIERGK